MKRMISSGSIEQFRTVTKNIQREAQYQGQDENDEPIFKKDFKMPTIKFIGTEKIHGSQMSISYSNADNFWVQSRKSIITPEKDNAGCAFQAYHNEEQWIMIIHKLAQNNDVNLDTHIITVFAEWCGGNIQKKSAVSGLDKRAIIFEYFKVSPIEPQLSDGTEQDTIWLETCYKTISQGPEDDCKVWVDNISSNIFNIMNFPTKVIEIDFNEPLMSQNKMIEMVEILEKDSLVGKAFGIDNNIGEGFVWSTMTDSGLQRFKTKGNLHSKGSGKIRTLKPVDEEFEKKKLKFVTDIACTESRLDQMFTEIVHSVHNGNASLMSMKDMGQYLQLVVKDVIKEESDIMQEQGLEPKQINGMISKVSRMYFQDRLDTEAGL